MRRRSVAGEFVPLVVVDEDGRNIVVFVDQFELGWRMATFALFRVASAVCPAMEERGKGTILVTSATAAWA